MLDGSLVLCKSRIHGVMLNGNILLYDNRDAAQIDGIPVFFIRF